MNIWSRDKNSSYLQKIGESRLVFQHMNANVQSEEMAIIAQLNRDIEAYQAGLEDEQAMDRRFELQEKIANLTKERDELVELSQSTVTGPALPEDSRLLYGLNNRLREIQDEEGAVKGVNSIQRSRELMQRKMQCIDTLETRRRPITEKKDFEETLMQIQNDDFMIKSFQDHDFDDLSIEYLMSSDVYTFFDDQLRKEIAEAQQQMITKGQVYNILENQEADQLDTMERADAEWFKFRGDNETLIKAIDAKNLTVIKQYLKNIPLLDRVDSIEPDSKADKWLQEYRRRLQDQQKERGNFAHRKRMEAERSKRKAVLKNISRDQWEKASKLLLEARGMRVEQAKKYLKEVRLERINRRFQENEKLFNAADKASVQELLTIAPELLSQPLNTAEDIKALNKRFDLAEKTLDDSVRELRRAVPDAEYIKANHPKVLENIRQRMAAIEKQANALTPEHAEQAKEAIRKKKITRLKEAGIVIPDNTPLRNLILKYPNDRELKEDLALIERLQKGTEEHKSETQKRQALKRRVSRLTKHSKAETLQEISTELNAMQDRLGLYQDDHKEDAAINTARKVREVMNKIKGMSDPEEIRQILDQEFSGHLKYVTSAQFKANYQKYTREGYMVFHEIGDEWEIIVDRDSLNDPAKLMEFKNQLNHELRHVEFENNAGLKDYQVQIYTTNKEWQAIKAAFVDGVTLGQKRPPGYTGPDKTYTVNDWSDEDVISELYAMDLGQESRYNAGADKTPINNLNNLIFEAGIAAAALAANDEEARQLQERYRGFESSHDDLGMAAMGEDGESGAEGGGSSVCSGSSKQYAQEIEGHAKAIKEIIESEYIGYVPGASSLMHSMQNYLNRTKKMNADFSKNGSGFLSDTIKSRLKLIREDLSVVTDKMAEVGGEIPNQTLNPLRNIWNNTFFLSIEDFIQSGKDAVEFFQRRHGRKRSEHAAKLGEALFQGTDLALESKARAQKAEIEEVEEWKGRYKNMDAWELAEIIGKLSESIDPSKDQLKAILQLLAEKGRIDWRDPHLWKVLNKLQGACHLTPGDSVLLHNPPLLRQKLHTATGSIWEYDEFLKLERDNESAYDSGIQKFIPSLDRIQDQLTDRMAQLLRDHRSGKNVDPQEFEAIMQYAIDKGKSDGESVLFYLITGMIEGLLNPDRGLAVDKNLNKWPATQWIYHQDPPLSREDYRWYMKKHFEKDFNQGRVDWQFKNFYWTVVANDIYTVQRVRKSVSERGWDHDWSRHITPLGDADTARRFLQGKSGQDEAKATAIENTYVGAVMWLEENAKVASRTDFRNNFIRQIGFTAMFDGILSNAAYRKQSGSPYTRMTDGVEKASAREVGAGHHADWTVGQHRDKIRDFMDKLDPVLFPLLRDTERATHDEDGLANEVLTHLKDKYKGQMKKWNSLKGINDIFDNMDFIVGIVMSADHISDNELLAKIKTLREGLPESGY